MKISTVATALCFGSAALAQVAKNCISTNLCYSLNIPDAGTSNGDVYFQITAPTSYQWAAFGQGTRMKGSNMFIIYADSTGNNVTVSPRLGTGDVEPNYNANGQITMLEGSGISNGVMTANFKCSTCESWSGGSMNFSSNAGKFIYAYKSGKALDTSSVSQGLDQHDDYGDFTLDFSQARGGSSFNPFVADASSPSGTSSTSSTSGTSTTATSSASSGASASSTPATTTSSSSGKKKHYPFNPVLFAHGLMASLAFVILMPAGAISIRIFNFPGLIWVHAAIQMLAYAVYIAAFGIGVYLAMNWGYLTDKHSIIGIVVFVLVFPQPFTGWLHHRYFKGTFSRSAWSHAHVWLGRIIVTIGIINGGFGLQLAENSTAGTITYGVVGGFIWLVYVACAIWGEMRKSKTRKGSSATDSGNEGLAKQRTHESGFVKNDAEKAGVV
ncbi:hypothetical protein MBLNU459_g3071t1 [Dothideomycetes sp. NU459]